jgi:hypothetical protein
MPGPVAAGSATNCTNFVNSTQTNGASPMALDRVGSSRAQPDLDRATHEMRGLGPPVCGRLGPRPRGVGASAGPHRSPTLQKGAPLGGLDRVGRVQHMGARKGRPYLDACGLPGRHRLHRIFSGADIGQTHLDQRASGKWAWLYHFVRTRSFLECASSACAGFCASKRPFRAPGTGRGAA